MQDRRLHANKWLGDVFIDGDLDDVRLITRESRKSAQVGAAVEEIAVEGAHAQTGGGSYTQNSLKTNLRRKVVAELTREFDCVFGSSGVPVGVEVRLATGIAWKIAQ